MSQSQGFYSAIAFIKTLKCRGSESGLLEIVKQGLDTLTILCSHVKSFLLQAKQLEIHTHTYSEHTILLQKLMKLLKKVILL